MASIDTSYITGASPTAAQDDASTIVHKQTLGQDDFLKLLVTQMSSQDPMNPMTDTNFIAQMAQFTSLENSKATQSGISLLQANSMIGRNVTLKDSAGGFVNGNVDGVQIKDGTPQIIVNGQTYSVGQVITIAAAVTQN